MEELPVEMVGRILSSIADARQVILASMACRKWRRAFREHLQTLSFKESDWRGFRGLSGSQLEALMSRTISQTCCLQSLTIDMDDLEVELPVSAVTSWLLHTRISLQELFFGVDRTDLPLTVVEEICGKLTLAYGVIQGVDPDRHGFPCLKSLSLIDPVGISDTDLRALVAACPALESLELINLWRVKNLRVVAPSLRSFSVRETNFGLDSLIFESDTVEHLHLKEVHCCFKFIGKGTLTNLTMDAAVARDLEIHDSAASLESIDIIDSDIALSELYRLIWKSSNLRKLRLRDVGYKDLPEAIDLETVALSCPQLSLLSLGCYDPIHPLFLRGSTRFENVVCLKVGARRHSFESMVYLVEGLLDRCPSLRQLVISGLEYRKANPHFRTLISRIRRKCVDSNVQLHCAFLDRDDCTAAETY